jgi:hypothetical protein
MSARRRARVLKSDSVNVAIAPLLTCACLGSHSELQRVLTRHRPSWHLSCACPHHQNHDRKAFAFAFHDDSLLHAAVSQH